MNTDDVDIEVAKTISMLLEMLVDKALHDGQIRELLLAMEYHMGRVAFTSPDPTGLADAMTQHIKFYAENMEMVWKEHMATCDNCRKEYEETQKKPMSVPISADMFNKSHVKH